MFQRFLIRINLVLEEVYLSLSQEIIVMQREERDRDVERVSK
jgi:hypothetical protein